MNLFSRNLKIFIFITLTAMALMVVYIRRNNTVDTRATAIPEFPSVMPTVTISPAIQESSMDSPDGKMTLTMKTQQNGSNVEYSFFTTVKSESITQSIFTKSEVLPNSLSIPYNTWSPNNVHFFLEETTPTLKNYYVFYANGKSFANEAQFLDIQDLFLKKVTGYTITDVTGWAAPNLIIVNTRANESDKKASFWFDVPSQSFIKLGTYFN